MTKYSSKASATRAARNWVAGTSQGFRVFPVEGGWAWEPATPVELPVGWEQDLLRAVLGKRGES